MQPTTLAFSKFLIIVGNGNSPETFASPCGLTTKSFDLSASSNDVEVPDCDDPDAPAWTDRVVKSLSGKVSGAGILAVESFDIWRDWALGGLPKNVRIQLVGTGLGYYSGSFILSTFSLKASLGDKVQVDISLDSDGQIIWTQSEDLTAPTITSASTDTVAENATLSHALTANESATWSIVGGADSARFEISGSTLRWLSNGTKNYEAPDDADTNNTYIVTVRATDTASNTADQTITVTVTDVDEVAPTITSANTDTVAENSTLSHALTANETVTWSIVGGADAARFEVSGSTLRWLSNGTKNYEAPDDADTNNTYIVTVRATDTASNTADQTITVTVTDVVEGGGTGDGTMDFSNADDSGLLALIEDI